MKAPHSYTAENTVEIDCHGGILVLRRILETVIKKGARPAEPGNLQSVRFSMEEWIFRRQKQLWI